MAFSQKLDSYDNYLRQKITVCFWDGHVELKLDSWKSSCIKIRMLRQKSFHPIVCCGRGRSTPLTIDQIAFPVNWCCKQAG